MPTSGFSLGYFLLRPLGQLNTMDRVSPAVSFMGPIELLERSFLFRVSHVYPQNSLKPLGLEVNPSRKNIINTGNVAKELTLIGTMFVCIGVGTQSCKF